MPETTTDEAILRFIDKMGPEFLFTIGILVIIAYVVIKAIPMLKELQLKRIEGQQELDMKHLEQETKREERKAQEFQQDIERDRARTEVIATQNEILKSVVTSNDAVAAQLEHLFGQFEIQNASLEESKTHSRALSGTVNETNRLVHDIHAAVVERRSENNGDERH